MIEGRGTPPTPGQYGGGLCLSALEPSHDAVVQHRVGVAATAGWQIVADVQDVPDFVCEQAVAPSRDLEHGTQRRLHGLHVAGQVIHASVAQ